MQKFTLPELKTHRAPILTPYFSSCWHITHNNSTADIFVSVCGRASERESEWEVWRYQGLAAPCPGTALFPVFQLCANFVPSLSLSYEAVWVRWEGKARPTHPLRRGRLRRVRGLLFSQTPFVNNRLPFRLSRRGSLTKPARSFSVALCP